MVIRSNVDFKINKSKYRDGDEGAAGSLTVDTSKLASYGDYLIGTKTDLDKLFSDLSKSFNSLTGSWAGSGSGELVTGFASLVTSASEIGSQLMELGIFAKGKAAVYDQILSDALQKMNSGG